MPILADSSEPRLAESLVSTDDERLSQAEALVRSYCGWHIAPGRTETLTVRTVTSSMILLPSLHVTEIASVISDGEAVATDGYEWSEGGLVLVASPGRTVVVTLTHGYDPIPAEVTAVVQAVAQRAVQNPGSLVRTQDGPFSDTFSQTGFNQSLPIALLDAEKAILDHYKLPSRP